MRAIVRSLREEEAVFLVVGSRSDLDWGEYPDIDMRFEPGRYSDPVDFRRKDGTKFPEES